MSNNILYAFQLLTLNIKMGVFSYLKNQTEKTLRKKSFQFTIAEKLISRLLNKLNKIIYRGFPEIGSLLSYRPFHKTLPRSSAFVNWISVRFYETGCTWALRDRQIVLNECVYTEGTLFMKSAKFKSTFLVYSRLNVIVCLTQVIVFFVFFGGGVCSTFFSFFSEGF